MLSLNSDVLYLIFEELQNDKKAFYSCLSVNKTWCEIIIPILWKNPWKYLNLKWGKEKLLLYVIISHLSDELRDSLSPDTNSSTYLYQKPLFNYISFCAHLDLCTIKLMIDATYINHAKSKIPIITSEIINLFINKNTKFTHLYLPSKFNYQIHIVLGAKQCLSELEYLYCYTNIEDGVLDGLLEMCKSIRILELYVDQDNFNHGIVKLIEIQNKLYNVRFEIPNNFDDESFYNKITYHKNSSSFKNLKTLKLSDFYYTNWNCFEDLSLPLLQILKAKFFPIKALASLIENTSGSLTEITISQMRSDDINDIDNKRIIQAIYQKCPNLNYLKILVSNSNILEFENLLINCKYLNGLVILTDGFVENDWDNLFIILSKSSPTGLYKFKIFATDTMKSLGLFFDNWKGRHPMSLQIITIYSHKIIDYVFYVVEKYKAEGIVERFDNGNDFEIFEWIQKKLRKADLYEYYAFYL